MGGRALTSYLSRAGSFLSQTLTVASLLVAAVAILSVIVRPEMPTLRSFSVNGPRFFSRVGVSKDEYAFFSFSVDLDTRPTFAHWNTQQVFVSAVGRSPRAGQFILFDAVLNPFAVPDEKMKLFSNRTELVVQSQRNRNPLVGQNMHKQEVFFEVHVDIFPYVGAMTRYVLPGSERVVAMPAEFTSLAYQGETSS